MPHFGANARAPRDLETGPVLRRPPARRSAMSRDPRGRLAGPLPTASRAVAIDVLVHGAQSRTQLAKKMGLSPATLTRLVRPLVESGVLVEGESVRSAGRGRSSVALDVVADDYRFVGVKLTSDSI